MAARDDKLLDLWRTRKAAAQQLRRTFEERWTQNWEWYRNTRKTTRLQGQFWQANNYVPDAFKVIETMTPQHVLSQFRSNNWFSVEAPSVPGDTYQRTVKSLLNGGWRKFDGFAKTVLATKYGNITGHVTAKLTWDRVIGEKVLPAVEPQIDATTGEVMDIGFTERSHPVLLHNGPQLHLTDNMNIWLDPTDKMKWVIERIPASLNVLKETNAQFGGTLYKNLNTVAAKAGLREAAQLGSTGHATYGGGSGVFPSTAEHTSVFGHTDVFDVEDLQSRVDGIPESFRRDPDHVDLWQCWGWVPKSIVDYSRNQPPGDTQWRLLVIANNETIIRDEPAPTPDRRPPYISCPAIPIPGQIYGDSVLSYIGPLIDLRSFIENARRDEVLLNMFGTYIVDARAQLRGQQMLREPGGAVIVDPEAMDVSAKDIITPIQRQPILPEAYVESAQKERQILDTSGATEPFQGKAFGGRTTATEASLVANLGTGRANLHTFWWDERWKKPILEKMFKFYQMKLTTPEVVELAGDPNMRGEIDFTDLQYDVDLYVDSGKLGSMDAQTIGNMQNLLAMFSQIPEAQMGIKWKELAVDAIYRLGLEGKYERSDEEIAAIQQNQQQQALLEAALSGSVGQSSPREG